MRIAGKDYLIPDATTNDFAIFGTGLYEWEIECIASRIAFRQQKNGNNGTRNSGEEGSFEALDKSYDSFNASLGYKTNLSKKLSLRVNVASGFGHPIWPS